MDLSHGVFAGVLAATAGLFGKLSGQVFVEGFWIEYAVQAGLVGAMVALNGLMWTYFVKALKTNSSLGATVITSATNFILSGLFGVLFLGEVTGSLWWCGISLVIVGTFLIQQSENFQKYEKLDNKSVQ